MGHYAERMCALPLPDAVQRILQQLDTVFGTAKGTARRLYCGAVRVNWAKEPFTRGAYCCLDRSEPVGARTELARPVGEELFFCGEATTRAAVMTAHAAIDSGRRAAREVLSCEPLSKL